MYLKKCISREIITEIPPTIEKIIEDKGIIFECRTYITA